jgi:hypothetical protein
MEFRRLLRPATTESIIVLQELDFVFVRIPYEQPR